MTSNRVIKRLTEKPPLTGKWVEHGVEIFGLRIEEQTKR